MARPKGVEALVRRVEEGLADRRITAATFLSVAASFANNRPGLSVRESLEGAARLLQLDLRPRGRRR